MVAQEKGENIMEKEKILLNAVIAFLVKGDDVLLARKTKKIGAGLWNGYGGGIEKDETPLDAMIRELHEECGVYADSRSSLYAAKIDFHNRTDDGKTFTCRCYVYLVTKWTGKIKATDEMTTPTWFPKNGLPLSEMMLADRVWVPPIFNGTKIYGEAWYGPRQQTLMFPTQIREVKNLTLEPA